VQEACEHCPNHNEGSVLVMTYVDLVDSLRVPGSLQPATIPMVGVTRSNEFSEAICLTKCNLDFGDPSLAYATEP